MQYNISLTEYKGQPACKRHTTTSTSDHIYSIHTHSFINIQYTCICNITYLSPNIKGSQLVRDTIPLPLQIIYIVYIHIHSYKQVNIYLLLSVYAI
jgi:hypothetical protein